MKKQENSESEKYTKYEKARLIGSRALQIAMGAPFMEKIDTTGLEALGYDPIKIAKAEYDSGLIPMTVRRPMPKTRVHFQEKAPVIADNNEAE